MRRSSLPIGVVYVTLLFFYLPIVILVINSFNLHKYGGKWSGFTLKWYARLLEDRSIWYALRNSLIVAGVSTVISTCLGTVAAWVLHRYQSRLQNAHYGLIYLPLVVPDILMGMSLLLFFVALGARLGLPTICVAHITFCVSYVTMVLLARLQEFDHAIMEAAYDLGASPRVAVMRVLLPALAPGIAAGALLAFTLSIDDFVITFFVAGPGSTTLPVHIYSMMKHSRFMPVINALSSLLLVGTFGVVLLSRFVNTTRKGLDHES